MSASLPTCPTCDSTHIVKNGKIHNGKQNYKCRNCGRQFVQDPQNKIIDPATKTLIDKLLLDVTRCGLSCFTKAISNGFGWL
jgi:transposase-like protein